MGQWQDDLTAVLGASTAVTAFQSVGHTSITAAAVSTLLSPSGGRQGVTIYNDADKDLYVSLGPTAASLTSFTLKIAPGGYYEVPFNFRGEIRGIWASSPTGAARISEITA